MVFQSYALYPHMNVFDNIGFSLKTSGVNSDILKKKVGEVAKILQLEDLLHRLPKQLSGGQKQRVAIGRAIIRKPKAFLFDEPLSNLDAALRVEMRLEISKLHKELGVTTIYVTHDQVEAMTLADKIVVLNEGKIIQIGSPHKLYNYPKKRKPSTPRAACRPRTPSRRPWRRRRTAAAGALRRTPGRPGTPTAASAS